MLLFRLLRHPLALGANPGSLRWNNVHLCLPRWRFDGRSYRSYQNVLKMVRIRQRVFRDHQQSQKFLQSRKTNHQTLARQPFATGVVLPPLGGMFLRSPNDSSHSDISIALDFPLSSNVGENASNGGKGSALMLSSSLVFFSSKIETLALSTDTSLCAESGGISRFSSVVCTEFSTNETLSSGAAEDS
ncbi:hypothetical protein HJC23_010672 [Cyclotella cryptica]|uniref:Uncharacterized protein n=1 Tax=Cyclotella cryptica TaxID=29204 RepID=A0ABD3PFI4_9STRA